MTDLSILEQKYTSWQKNLLEKRKIRLQKAHQEQISHLQPAPDGDEMAWVDQPNYGQCQVTPDVARTGSWKIDLPDWCQDQRNQMTGPADDMELVVKMINSGAPGVMLDLEDSCANTPHHIAAGIQNVTMALQGNAAYTKNNEIINQDGTPVILVRPRGLHLSVWPEGTSASFYDVTRVALNIDPEQLRHPLCFYIPKSESAEEALWWRDLFRDVADMLGKPSNWIKCMALIESHPLAYEMEEFVYNLRDHLIGLNLGRWDYMASLAHWNLYNEKWVLPDRNKIPHDVAFFQNLRYTLVNVCHRRGILAIGGMTALFPDRKDPALNARAMEALTFDKKNEADCGFDGAWTGHPDQNEIAIEQFPVPNQILKIPEANQLDLRPKVEDREFTPEGTKAAVRTAIRYRYGVLMGKGASLLDGYMEDLATDRIYRIMLAQRLKYGIVSMQDLIALINEQVSSIITENGGWNNADVVLNAYEASFETLGSILTGQFDPE